MANDYTTWQLYSVHMGWENNDLMSMKEDDVCTFDYNSLLMLISSHILL